jgi:thioredoxin-related protein
VTRKWLATCKPQLKKFFMKKMVFLALIAGLGICTLAAFRSNSAETTTTLKWYTWEEAAALQKTKPKKIFVDVFTDWCGWCKRMDKSTFSDEKVAAYMAANYYPVKLNAEQKADILFNGETFKYVANDNGRGGVHTLAYALLDGKMGYPSMVYLNEKYERIMISPGFKEVDDMLKELKFAAEEKYKETSWEEYRNLK